MSWSPWPRSCRLAVVPMNIPAFAPIGEKVDVGPLHELGRLDAERGHEAMGLRHPCRLRLSLGQHDLQLEEVSELIDAVEVHPRPADPVEPPTLADPANRPVGE